ncbi:glycoside hydrolase family 3 N-terminal domain-containing protein [Hymenobacter swuensis]|uniref:beta-N-acetylhexosaminidase n=1 Tax=Hymenobacter swuensis DY53 TaxID=1227739 RepID=W8F4D4_9BACT|nr:glycoside hydrolase family 3 N-terminal domain-containing protein [Hymenobacter swuensis]AHJ96630.1 putative beta-hexosaminidase [Hymenobacter swuensis DY53]
MSRFLSLLLLALVLLSPESGSAQRRRKKSTRKLVARTVARRAPVKPVKPVRKAALTAPGPKPGPSKTPTAAKSRNQPVPFAGQLSQSRWVDSVMKTLTPDQRVAQLFMVAAYSNRKRIDEDSVSTLIQQYGIGGLIFFQGGPVRQSRLLNRYQSQAKVPLLVAMDAEWGVGMRLDSVVRFPYQMSMGGVRQTQLVYDMGTEVAAQFKRLGMHVNFAPVIDVNNNAANPVIGFRSWGENREDVTEKSYLYMKGMQDAGVLAVAKHFPGHGDTDTDSHLALPLLRIDKKRIDTLELFPFKSLIQRGIGGVMVAHLNIPALDTTGMPSTLSKPIIQGLLRRKLGFEGVVFTDAMNMKGVISKYPPGDADLRALLAGNDVLEFSKNIPLALRMIREAINRGEISQEEIDRRCRKVLALKQWSGLDKYRPIELRNITVDLNTPHSQYLSRQLSELSVTVLRNQRSLLPLQHLDTLRLATLTIGTRDTTDFQRMVADYAPVRHFWLSATASLNELARMRETLKPYNLVLVGLNNLGRLPATNFGVTPETNVLLRELGRPQQRLVVAVFGNAYAVAKVRDLDRADAVVLAYQESKNAQDVTAEVIFGGISASGKLPVTISDRYPYGFGLATQGGIRLRYSQPEAVGLNNNLESRVDSLMNVAIAARAFPGAQVVIARRGTVVLQKSYGTHTYPTAGQAARPVRSTDLYDLASLTKVSAALPALMKLQDEGKFNPDMTMGQLFPELVGTNKQDLKLRDVLTHQARLKAWIPFWKDYTKPRGFFNGLLGKSPAAKDVSSTKPAELNRRYFRPDSSARFPLPAGPRLWARKDFPERIVKAIGESPLNEKPGYVYSDLSFILYPRFVQRISGKPLGQFVTDEVYRPLGATTLGYNPTRRFPLSRIAPTEYDSLFRHGQLHGTVHDEGAALLGGLSGHAGLFGSANDLAKLVQLYAWNGRYGGQQLLKAETVQEYTRCQFCPDNRRALGFDRPAANPAVNSAPLASPQSYGHTGFTGTYFWVDPKEEITCVVLTNRVNPTRRNNKITELSVRSGILQIALQSVRQPQKQEVESTVPKED